MKLGSIVLLLSIGMLANAWADGYPEPYKKFSGIYQIYGGGLGDPIAAKPKDRKIAFSIEGTAAKEIFDAIGPDKEDICSHHSSSRLRHKDNENLTCRRSEQGQYICDFGFDLDSGKSIGGSIC